MRRQVMHVVVGLVLVPTLAGCGIAERVRAIGAPTTRIELVASPADGASAAPDEMDAAAELVTRRLESEERRVSDVVVDEATITLVVTGEVGEATRSLISERGDLTFRPVLLLGGPEPDSEPTGGVDSEVTPAALSQFEALDCASPQPPDSAAAPDLPAAMCDQQGTAKYLLGPAVVGSAELAEVSSSQLPGAEGAAGDSWGVGLQLDASGTQAFADVTERLQGSPVPRNQLAIAVDGLVITAPSIQQGTVITNGAMQIAGSFTEESAATLAHQLASDPLPFPFEVRDVSESE